jgi:hypothetical protein
MKSKVKAFVEFRFDHLIKKDILNSYIIIMLFNIILNFLSKGLGEQILFGAMLFFFIFISNRVLSRVKKFMMRTYLYKGIVSIYLNILFTITFYYVIHINKQHDYEILFFLFLIVLYFNVVSYILAKYNIKKGAYVKENIDYKYKHRNKKAILVLLSVIFIYGSMIMSLNEFNLTETTVLILYLVALFCTFYFMFRFNSVNVQILKAYYIKKFNLEKDELNYVDLEVRLSRC